MQSCRDVDTLLYARLDKLLYAVKSTRHSVRRQHKYAPRPTDRHTSKYHHVSTKTQMTAVGNVVCARDSWVAYETKSVLYTEKHKMLLAEVLFTNEKPSDNVS
jgi:hypothetical protein